MTMTAPYETDGYVFPLRAMRADSAHDYRAQLEQMEQHSADGKVNTRGYGNIAVSFIDEITRLDSILDPVSDILGPDLLVWGRQPVHQKTRTPRTLSAGIRT